MTSAISTSTSTSFPRLQDELDEFLFEFMEMTPREILDIFEDKAEKLAMSGIAKRAVKVDSLAPFFSLPDADGNIVSLIDLLAQGPVVLTFYRGNWCPYCNIALRSLQKNLKRFRAKGANLVAISPQLPDFTKDVVDSNDLEFPVLSDVGMKVGRKYGVDFVLDEELRPIYKSLGIDVSKHNGDTLFRLPVPGTFVIDTDGTVLYSFLNTDYTKRAEPDDILDALPNDYYCCR